MPGSLTASSPVDAPQRMRGLTVWQPVGQLTAAGIKLAENRKTAPPKALVGVKHGLAIHAGKHFDLTLALKCHETMGGAAGDVPAWSPVRSAIVAVVTIVDFVRVEPPSLLADRIAADVVERWKHGQGRWAWGPVVWMLDDLITLPEPVPCSGTQGVWVVPSDVEAAVRVQMAAAVPA